MKTIESIDSHTPAKPAWLRQEEQRLDRPHVKISLEQAKQPKQSDLELELLRRLDSILPEPVENPHLDETQPIRIPDTVMPKPSLLSRIKEILSW